MHAEPRSLRAALALCAALAAPPAFPQEPLHFDEALRLAEQRSFDLVAHDAAQRAARELAVAAGRRPDPTLGIGVDNVPIDGPDRFTIGRDFMTMRSLSLMQALPTGAKLSARAARFDAEAEVALARRTVAAAALRRDAATAWLQLHGKRRLVDLLLRQRDEARLQIDAAEAAYRSGRGLQAEVFGARAAVERVEDQIDQAERDLAVSQAQLARWVGSEAAQRPPGDAPPAQPWLRDPARRADDASRHPEVAVMAREEDVARAEAESARTELRPDWSAAVMLSRRGSPYSNMVSLNLTVPLQLDRANRQQREVAAKLAALERKSAEREEAARALAARASVVLHEWRSALERLRRYDAALLPLAGQRAAAATAAWRGGTGTLASVLEARRSHIETAVERMRLEIDASTLWAQLQYLVPDPGSPAGAAR